MAAVSSGERERACAHYLANGDIVRFRAEIGPLIADGRMKELIDIIKSLAVENLRAMALNAVYQMITPAQLDAHGLALSELITNPRIRGMVLRDTAVNLLATPAGVARAKTLSEFVPDEPGPRIWQHEIEEQIFSRHLEDEDFQKAYVAISEMSSDGEQMGAFAHLMDPLLDRGDTRSFITIIRPWIKANKIVYLLFILTRIKKEHRVTAYAFAQPLLNATQRAVYEANFLELIMHGKILKWINTEDAKSFDLLDSLLEREKEKKPPLRSRTERPQ